MDVTLEIFIDKKGRQYLLDTKQRIGIIKSYLDDSDLKFICLAFDPFGDTSQVVFHDEWQAIAGVNEPESLEVFQYNDSIDVRFGNVYNITNTGFGGVERTCPDDYVGITNSRTNSVLYTGLSQKINENFCVSIVSATPVNNTAFYESSNEIWVFTATDIATNMAIFSFMLLPQTVQAKAAKTTVSKYLSIKLQKDTNIYFDNLTNLFMLGNPPCLPIKK